LDGCLLDAHFTRLVYKRILDKPVTYHDMASVDVQFYKSLCWLLENKLEGIDLSLTFSVDKENFGAYEEIELKEKGKDMVVTEQNKREYVDLLASWRLKGVASMFASLFSNAYELHLYNW
jgi:E3 ubiquitin-protein ligase HUWE1